MKDPIKNGYINWIDGMKITKDHFIQMQRAVEDRIRDSRVINSNSWGFGLIPGKVNGRDSLDYNLLTEHPNKIFVELYQCRGLTPSGDRAEIVSRLNSQEVALKKRFELDLESGSFDKKIYDVILKVDSFELAPYGEPDVKESPPRHPYAAPEYELEIVPSREIEHNDHNRNFIVITRIESGPDGLTHISDYIPPCLSMEARPELTEFYFKYLKFLKDLEQNLFKIVVKLNSASQKTQLATNVDAICRRMLDLLERDLDACAMNLRHGHPSELITQVMSFARTVKYAIELTTNIGKDEYLNYIQEIISVSPGDYLRVHEDLIHLEYDHYNINESLVKILSFCKVNGRLFDELSRLDYIGKKKDADIYVAEKPMETKDDPAKPKRQWDF